MPAAGPKPREQEHYLNRLDDESEVGTVTAAQISDATAAGRSMLTAANAAAQLTLVGGEGAQTAVSQVEAEAGTGTVKRSWTPERVAQAIAALAVPDGIVLNDASGAPSVKTEEHELIGEWTLDPLTTGYDLSDTGANNGTDGSGLTFGTESVGLGSSQATGVTCLFPVDGIGFASADSTTYLDNSGLHGNADGITFTGGMNGTDLDGFWDVGFPAGSIHGGALTVATLPAGVQGQIAYVTDALAPAYLTTVVGGGAVVTPVFFDGTNWVAH